MAWLVVSSHVLAQAGFHDRPLPRGLGFLRNGGLGIEVFVILSGFVIFHLLNARPEPMGTFLFRRAVRLYPAYLAALAAGVAVSFRAESILAALPWSDGPTLQVIRANWAASQEFFFPQLALHLALLHGLIPNELLPFSTSAFVEVAWSLSLEWQFYLVAPLLLWALRKYRSRAALGLLAVIVLCVRVQPYFGDFFHSGRVLTWHLKAFLPLMIQLFAVGIGSFYLLRGIRRQRITTPPFLPLLAAAAGYVLDAPAAVVVWSAVFAVVVALGQDQPDRVSAALGRALRSRVLQYLGRVSYSTYLLHIPVIYVITWLLERGHLIHGQAQFAAFLALLTAVGVFAVSHLSYRWIEQPALRWAALRLRPCVRS